MKDKIKEILKELVRVAVLGAVSAVYLKVKGDIEATDLAAGTLVLKLIDHYLHRVLKGLGYPAGVKGLTIF